MPFVSDEILHLLIGIELFGMSKWKEILEKYRDHFHESRKSNDLKDKYRNLEHHPEELAEWERKAKNAIKNQIEKRN